MERLIDYGCMNWWTDRQMDELTDDKQTVKRTERWRDRQTYGWIDWWTDRQVDGQTGR